MCLSFIFVVSNLLELVDGYIAAAVAHQPRFQRPVEEIGEGDDVPLSEFGGTVNSLQQKFN